jgi:hypothetical protein
MKQLVKRRHKNRETKQATVGVPELDQIVVRSRDDVTTRAVEGHAENGGQVTCEWKGYYKPNLQ